jgi:hypothetical protein
VKAVAAETTVAMALETEAAVLRRQKTEAVAHGGNGNVQYIALLLQHTS